MSVVKYFMFLIGLCVFTILFTIIVLHLHLRAQTKPIVAMPVWVSRSCYIRAVLGYQNLAVKITAIRDMLRIIGLHIDN